MTSERKKMKPFIGTLTFVAGISGAAVVACGSAVAPKDQCTSHDECAPGQTCSSIGACVDVPTDSGLVGPGQTDPGPLSPATCSTPSGAVHTFQSVTEVAELLTGKWKYCDGAPPDFSDGVEFTSDGTYYVLAFDANGTLVRHVRSFGGEEGGTVDVSLGSGARDYATLTLRDFLSTGSTQIIQARVSDPPRKIMLDPSTYVPVP